jgi:hypothetical protein
MTIILIKLIFEPEKSASFVLYSRFAKRKVIFFAKKTIFKSESFGLN